MAPTRTLIALLGMLAFAITSTAAYSGDGTAYSGCGEHDKTGGNSCGFSGDELSGDWNCMYAALPSGCGSRSGGCGDCVEVCGSKGCVVVKVVDTCGSCSCGDIDLSTDALKASTGYSWDRKHVTWKWTSCSGGSSASSADSTASADTSSSSSSDEESDSKRKRNNNDRRLLK
ncbi:hypothetical protein D9Q98_001385 [Chlorella vulgaris]|uniref:Expansin-like EG45 domain-containing protein n=1 Tax=Chlorella vulgaris TaxID=3077 RepID=A0A9D4Z2L2_CHLVU|nr:hypothetical protein D9Q98_001384 [Chlorella vulgaris]KAI3438971.1 hypothetical protein D9Q98_001385 [Chlorella vulgaris]